MYHDDVIKWKHYPRYWPFVRGIHRSTVNSPHKGHWRGTLKFSLIYIWINDWVNNREAGDLRRYRANYDIIVMQWYKLPIHVAYSFHSNGLRSCLQEFNTACLWRHAYKHYWRVEIGTYGHAVSVRKYQNRLHNKFVKYHLTLPL